MYDIIDFTDNDIFALGSTDIHTPLKIPNVYFKRFLPLSNQVCVMHIFHVFALFYVYVYACSLAFS